MLVPAPDVSPLFLSAVEELKRRGVEPTPSEIAWLYEASRHAIGETRECPRWVDPDVWVGGIVLHGLTVGAILWWEKYGSPLYAAGPETDRLCAWAWLLHHANDRKYLARHVSGFSIRTAVFAFVVGLPWRVTLGDIAWAVAAALGDGRIEVGPRPSGRVAKGASAIEWGETVAWLSHEYKRPPEDFLWGMDMAEVAELSRAAVSGDRANAAREAEKLAAWRAVVEAVADAHKPAADGEGK